MKLACGDIVRLKAGGPAMIVKAILTRRVRTLWFDNGIMQRDSFRPEALEKITHG